MKVLLPILCLVAVAFAESLFVNAPYINSGGSGSAVIHSPVLDMSSSPFASAPLKCAKGHKVEGLKPGVYKIHSGGCAEFLTPLTTR